MNMATKIKVVGIGGSGGNAVSRMKKFKMEAVELIALNTDEQDLKKVNADVKLRIGKKITQGLGTGMKPEIGEAAAKESQEEISQILKAAEMIFLTGGLGGGTFSGAAPFIAQISRDLGILTVAVATLPFSFEGEHRKRIARESKKLLEERVDALLTIENDKLLATLDPNISLISAFWVCDDILREAVKGISDLIFLPGIINVNFADIKAILKNSGTALFGTGSARGEKRAQQAVNLALNSPLLNLDIKGAKGILFNVSGSDISLSEIEEIGEIVTKEANPEAKIIFGALEDEKIKKGEIKVTLIATGF